MTVKETAQRAGGKMRETIDTTRTKASETYEAASNKAGEAYAAARERTALAGRKTAKTVDNNPLAAVIGGLGIGMLVGALLPKSRREEDLLGPYGSKITSRAREAANAAKSVGQEKLDELGFVRDEAKETAQKVLDKSKEAASEAGTAAARKARGKE